MAGSSPLDVPWTIAATRASRAMIDGFGGPIALSRGQKSTRKRQTTR